MIFSSSAVAIAVWLFAGFYLFVTGDGDCDIAPWCDGQPWPLWTGEAALSAWVVLTLAIVFFCFRKFRSI